MKLDEHKSKFIAETFGTDAKKNKKKLKKPTNKKSQNNQLRLKKQ